MRKQHISLIIVVLCFVTACKPNGYLNFTTYFNTFYNEERLMSECEEEFEFQLMNRRTAKPKVLVPMPLNPVLNTLGETAPQFLTGFRIDKATRQTVETKLDSILVKGSKILAKSSGSDYVAPSLYLMAKSYFYKEEWLPSQIKCSELIDKEPVGKYSADAHLLLATNLLMQGKYDAGLTMLSRTVDVAWLNNRYDILTQAFNIEAEMALYYGNYEDAIRPYFQAIAQSDDNKQKAIWQNEMAAILFRLRRYDRAEKAFAKVMQFSPDLTTEYEARLYRASCLIRLEQYNEAEQILARLDNDGKFEEWKDYVITQRLVQSLRSGDSEQTKQLEFHADSLYPTSQVLTAYYFEKGLDEYEKGDWINTRSYMAKARGSRTPSISQPANKIFIFMNQREHAVKDISDRYAEVDKFREIDSLNKAKASVSSQANVTVDTNFAYTDSLNAMKSNLPPTSKDTNTIEDKIKSFVSENPNDSTNNFQKLNEIEWNNNIRKPEDTVSSFSQTMPKIDTLSADSASSPVAFVSTNQDESLVDIARSYYELARLHYNIGNVDSANYYYEQAAIVAPLTQENSSRYLYIYAESIRDTNAWKADSILNVIVQTQPKSEYGKIALKQLGYTEAFIMDTAASIYNSGYDLMKYNEYELAKQRLLSVYTNYPKNLNYAPKALYTLGFMYEEKLANFDSAAYYYNELIKKYPTSEYAKELALSVNYKYIVDSGEEIPDSLKTKEVVIYKADTSILSAPYDSTLLSKPIEDDGFSFDDLKNPSKLLEKAKKKMSEQFDKAKEAVKNPGELLDKAKESAKETLKEGISVPKPEDFMPKKEGETEETPPLEKPETESDTN